VKKRREKEEERIREGDSDITIKEDSKKGKMTE
jgi:hypothetical protein